jgi:aminoglycoside 6'-N-acetyltransferase
MDGVRLRPLAEADLPLLHDWFNSPHMQPFYMDKGAEMSGEEVREKFLPRTESARPEKCFIAEMNSAAYGYVQAYPNGAFEDICALIGESNGVSVDYFIGDHTMVGKGLAQQMLRAFQHIQFGQFFPGETAITLHHDVTNSRAMRCSLAVGFVPVRFTSKHGKEQLVMKWTRKTKS